MANQALSCPHCGRTGTSSLPIEVGRAVRCPGCGTKFIAGGNTSPIIPTNVFKPIRSSEDEAPLRLTNDSASRGSKSSPVEIGLRHLKNPIMLIGGVFPAIVLIGFLGYLWYETTTKARADTVRTLKIEADRLSALRPEEALEKYEQLVLLIGNPSRLEEEQSLLAVTLSSRAKLLEVVQPIRDRRKAESDEAVRLATLKAKSMADAARLECYRANISGIAWVDTKAGTFNGLRGVKVSLIRRESPRSELGYLLEPLQKNRTVGSIATRNYDHLPPDQPIDVKGLWSLIRLDTMGPTGTPNDERYQLLRDDAVWPIVVRRAAIATTETGIDGKFSMEKIKGGRYYVVAEYFTEHAFIEWILDISVEKSGIMTVNLHNKNADMILNKSDDGG